MKDLSKVKTSDLIDELRNREEIIAVQVWDTKDIFIEANECLGFSKKDAKKIADSYKGATVDKASLKEALEDCSEEWNPVDDAILGTAKRLGVGEFYKNR